MKIVAEVGVNHGGTLERFINTVKKAKESGADAVKIQTYTPESLTIKCKNNVFRYKGRFLWDIYKEAHIPREWHYEVFKLSEKDQPIFSTPFSKDDVDFLEQFDPPFYKISSFETNDLDFVDYVASTKRPLVISLGNVHRESEIKEILEVIQKHQDASKTTLLHCVSEYPCSLERLNLWKIPALKKLFPNLTIGFSDHTTTAESSVAAAVLGAEYIEKHFYFYPSSIDKSFSLHSTRFQKMVCDIREIILGCEFNISSVEHGKALARSCFVVQDISRGEIFTNENVKVIRPGMGAHPSQLKNIIGQVSKIDVHRGTPFKMDFIDGHKVCVQRDSRPDPTGSESQEHK